MWMSVPADSFEGERICIGLLLVVISNQEGLDDVDIPRAEKISCVEPSRRVEKAGENQGQEEETASPPHLPMLTHAPEKFHFLSTVSTQMMPVHLRQSLPST